MSQFVEVKTSELTGPALDWAVGVAEGNPMQVPVSDVVWSDHHGSYSPSIDWSQGGPLRDKHRVGIEPSGKKVYAWTPNRELDGFFAETALIAICRAIVSAKLGDVVNIPKDLLVEE